MPDPNTNLNPKMDPLIHATLRVPCSLLSYLYPTLCHPTMLNAAQSSVLSNPLSYPAFPFYSLSHPILFYSSLPCCSLPVLFYINVLLPSSWQYPALLSFTLLCPILFQFALPCPSYFCLIAIMPYSSRAAPSTKYTTLLFLPILSFFVQLSCL